MTALALMRLLAMTPKLSHNDSTRKGSEPRQKMGEVPYSAGGHLNMPGYS